MALTRISPTFLMVLDLAASQLQFAKLKKKKGGSNGARDESDAVFGFGSLEPLNGTAGRRVRSSGNASRKEAGKSTQKNRTTNWSTAAGRQQGRCLGGCPRIMFAARSSENFVDKAERAKSPEA